MKGRGGLARGECRGGGKWVGVGNIWETELTGRRG